MCLLCFNSPQGILYLCYYAGAIAVLLWSSGGDVPHTRYGPVLFWATYYFMAWAAMGLFGILAKWVLLGRGRPGGWFTLLVMKFEWNV